MAKKGRRATEEERILAIQLIESGRKFDDVAEIMGVGRRTVFEWWEKYRNSGLAGLSAKFASGRPTALSDRQMLELRALITGADPRQLSFGLALWTRDMVRELIRRRFRVSVSAVTVGRILKKLGMSPQRPLYRAYQQNPEKVREWKEKTYPRSVRKPSGAVRWSSSQMRRRSGLIITPGPHERRSARHPLCGDGKKSIMMISP